MDAAPGPHCTPAEFRALGTMDGLESLLTPFVCLLTPLWLHPFSQCLAMGAHAFPLGLCVPQGHLSHVPRITDAADRAMLSSNVKLLRDFLCHHRVTSPEQTQSLVNTQHSPSLSHPAPQTGKCHRWPVPAGGKHSQCR